VPDVLSGYGWTAAALIGRRIDPRAANALSVLLAGAARVLEHPGAAPPKEGHEPIRFFIPTEDLLAPIGGRDGVQIVEGKGTAVEDDELPEDLDQS
jgi:hypothetical protein